MRPPNPIAYITSKARQLCNKLWVTVSFRSLLACFIVSFSSSLQKHVDFKVQMF